MMKVLAILLHYAIQINILLQCNAFDEDECRTPLGMESGSIPDSALTSSSSFDGAAFGPGNARIQNGVDSGGGAWCPGKAISMDVYEWIEIDLQGLKVITKIETQGHPANTTDHEYAEAYFVEYKRTEESQWKRFKNRLGTQVFMGNSNAHSIASRTLVPPLIARRVRVVPYSNRPRRICLRLELYGCPCTVGLVSYSLPQGVVRGLEVDLFDHLYDGDQRHGHLSGGLGQLTDGILGNSNFRLDSEGQGRKGYGWIGWKNDSIDSPLPVEILFQFEAVKVFTGFHVHSNNMFSKEVRVFRKVVLEFGTISGSYEAEKVTAEVSRDDESESARYVDVVIPNRMGRYIKVMLYFDARWLMISEVKFDTRDAFPAETELPVTGSSNYRSSDVANERVVAIVTGCLAAVAIILSAVVLLVLLRSHRAGTCPGTRWGSHVPRPGSQSTATENQTLDGSYREPVDENEWCHLPAAQSTTTDDCSDVTSSIYATPLVQPKGSSSRSGKVRHGLLSVFDSAPRSRHPPSLSPPPPHPTQPEGSSRSDGSIHALKCLEKMEELERERINFMGHIRNGAYGEVCLCEMLDNHHVTCDSDHVTGLLGHRLVVVKILSAQEDENARIDFCWEASALFSLRDHPNIVRLVGVIRQTEPPCLVLEYLPYGDLEHLLQQCSRHSLEGEDNTDLLLNSANCLSYGCLIYMATQISSAMLHLESRGFIHRKLAARSCLVGEEFLVKLSDFRSFQAVEESDHSRPEVSRMFPLRWLSPESILMGRFSSMSDVWSFGVTLWEIMSLCQAEPFHHMTFDELMDNARMVYSGEGQPEHLERPPACPSEIHDLMVHCWNGSELARPTFREINAFLKSRNVGYSAQGDLQSLRILSETRNRSETGSCIELRTSTSTDVDPTMSY